MSAGIAGILLAAGQGRRFGSNKLLHKLDDGTPMVLASARHLRNALPRTLAVVAEANDDVAQLLAAEGMEVVVNAQASAGMGTSIACGVTASRDAQGWLVALGDMPFVPEPVIAELAIRLAGGAELVAPVYRQRRGHPVGFSARYAAALTGLQGDTGAREILAAHSGSLQCLTVDDSGVLMDIDTPDQRPERRRPAS